MNKINVLLKKFSNVTRKENKPKESDNAPPTRTRARFHDEQPESMGISDIKKQLAKEIRASYTQCTQHGDLYRR